MGFLDKLFGRHKQPTNTETQHINQISIGEKIVANNDHFAYKIIRNLSDKQGQALESATLPLRTGELYMHYWTEDLTCTDRNDQEWQNKVMFFWKADEPFPKKSLPPNFESFDIKHFLFQGDTSSITLHVGQAMPWFGMPGLGNKHVCAINGAYITIPETYEMGLVNYVEVIPLTEDNLSILTDNSQYAFILNEAYIKFKNGVFLLNGQEISIQLAYSIGGIDIIKIQETS